ncbi:MAG: HD domain-containing protein [Bacteriovoracia bacterium]
MIPQALIDKIKPYYEAQDPGHDWAHILRVTKTAEALAKSENADLSVVLPAAFLHDIVNVPKDHPERTRASTLAADKAIKLLSEVLYDETKFEKIHQAIVEHSWSKGLKPSSIESACVQDADRLDAIGAIGVLRCTAVNVQMKSHFYDPADPFAEKRELNDKTFMVDHYFVKLLKIADSLQTKAAKVEGQRRTEFMRHFLDQLKNEIKG